MKNRDRAKQYLDSIESLRRYKRQTSSKDGDIKAEIQEEIDDLQKWVERLMSNPDSDDPNSYRKSFTIFWNNLQKKLIGPANWTYTHASDLRTGDKVQGTFGYSKIARVTKIDYTKRKKSPEDLVIFKITLDDGRVFNLLPMEGFTISRTKDEIEW